VDTQDTKPLKIYHLTVHEDISDRIKHYKKGWFGWYTEETEILVAANSEEEARILAWREDEDYIFWKHSDLSTCEEIKVDKPMILIAQSGTG
jgi:hypothetical protein